MSDQPKLILVYTTVYGRNFTHYFPLRNSTLCDYKCRWSDDKKDYNRSDSVLFHLYNNVVAQYGRDFSLKQLPKRYSLDQKWILMAREPQAFYYPKQLKLLNGMFNLTMTFQRDSDVTIPYGAYYKRKQAFRNWQKAPANKDVAWIVSNCITSSRRENYVKELQNYIDVDVYGECGKNKQKEPLGFVYNLSTKYNFYLAFENSDCTDYVTEKLWRALEARLIPVVRGCQVNYTAIAPPNSFIHADSFSTPKKLAEYLKKVSSNKKLFNKYHKWRRLYKERGGMTSNHRWSCDLCRQVYLSKHKNIDVYEHFSEDTRCTAHREQKNNRTGERLQDLRL